MMDEAGIENRMSNTPCVLSRRRFLNALACGSGAALLPDRTFATTGEQIRVVDFGARGLGEGSDDTQAIQGAIDEAYRRGGGLVLFDEVPDYHAVSEPLVMRPGVSLKGLGGHTEIRSRQPGKQLLLPGNFHPAYLSGARYDSIDEYEAGTRTIRVSKPDATARYPVGSQVWITSVGAGRSGTFSLPRYGWLNTITGVSGRELTLREPVDVAVRAQITPLAGLKGRFDIPLFFWSDAEISGLAFSAIYHFTMDSAALNVRFTDNLIRAKSGIYGNAFQHVEWRKNRFEFTHMLGEQSQNSIGNSVIGNTFRYVGGRRETYERSQYFGLYFQEFARKIEVANNHIDFADFNSNNFAVSIARAQDVVVRNLTATGDAVPSVIYMGAPAEPEFAVTGNYVRDCTFDTGASRRFVTVDGHGDAGMHGNGILDCRFLGTASEPDAARLHRMNGAFEFQGNRWPGKGSCYTLGKSRGVKAAGNANLGRSGDGCLAIN